MPSERFGSGAFTCSGLDSDSNCNDGVAGASEGALDLPSDVNLLSCSGLCSLGLGGLGLAAGTGVTLRSRTISLAGRLGDAGGPLGSTWDGGMGWMSVTGIEGMGASGWGAMALVVSTQGMEREDGTVLTKRFIDH
jgi:hypothetical protein